MVVSDVLPSLAAPSGKVGLQCGASLPERDAKPALMSGLSSDAGTDLEDKLCRFQPLPETLSPLSDSSVGNLPMSPSRYPAMAVPELDRPASVTQMSPTLVRRVHSLHTMDFFPTYAMSLDVSFYEPATSPVTPAPDYVSLGGPASIRG